eukprot:CAMPEP_0113721454 /NCGR_PEP_ID=MMETSP0038_2-20120614/37147_1 /TAXON_ID=2898 /ORGANISM="Cryptomonas paramecium" /LENGTH=39 /DNA_ID=CAMNT_0000650475 /DNA_START=206 /DNA_END=322 /DNA_ORIENTATION=+ /assembly_acc=CAM_ASM_000170
MTETLSCARNPQRATMLDVTPTKESLGDRTQMTRQHKPW